MRTIGKRALGAILLGGAALAPAVPPAAAEPTLLTFGDSYTVNSRSGFPQWAKQLLDEGRIGTLHNFAQSGAYAASAIGTTTLGKSFKVQINRWKAAGSPKAAGTVVFLGINEITDPNVTSYSQSRSGYRSGVDALLSAGLNTEPRELLLVMPHDAGAFPRYNGVYKGTAETRQKFRDRTKLWNSFVSKTAVDKGATAVNLFSVVDKVLANPGGYKLSNVTSPSTAPDALFIDEIHFGRRGQEIIKQAVASQLSATGVFGQALQASARTSARQQVATTEAVRAGIAALVQNPELGLVALPLGQAEPPPEASQFSRAFVPLGERQDGIALAYAPREGTIVGLVVSDQGVSAESGAYRETRGASLSTRSTSLFVHQEAGASVLETRLTHGRERHETLRFDDITGDHDRASFGGTTLSLAQRVGRPVRGEAGGRGYVATPWAELSHEERRVDGFTLESPFAPDQRYAASAVGDTLASVGLDARLEPIDLGEGRWLSLWGEVSYAHGLAQDDYRVRVTEAAFGTTREETVERPATRAVGLGLGAGLALGEGLSLDGSLALRHDLALGTAEAGRIGLTLRF